MNEQGHYAPPENLIIGRNVVREALKNGRELEKVIVQEGQQDGSLRELVALAREKGVIVQKVMIPKNNSQLFQQSPAKPQHNASWDVSCEYPANTY